MTDLDKAIQRTEKLLAGITPGTWRHEFGAGDAGNNHSVLFGDARLNQWIARIVSGRGNGGAEERQANAAFIASAPDLIRLMLDVVKAAANHGSDHTYLNQALTAFGERVGGG
jgi:hypothetical protein